MIDPLPELHEHPAMRNDLDMDTSIYKSRSEMASHEDAIKRLCQEHPGQETFIRQRYMEVLRPLASRATIRTYLAIFATRGVKAMISKLQH